MKINLTDALELSLQAMAQGADIETCLAKYPHLADDLRPLLVAAVDAQSLADIPVPDAVLRRGRARLLDHAAELREQPARKPLFVLPFFHRARLTRMALTFFSVFAFLMTGGTGLVSASSNAIPGDRLYTVKRSWEDVQLWFVFDEASREALEHRFEEERVSEVHTLLLDGREEEIEFSGLITAQDGDLWQIGGVSVRIVADTQIEGTVRLGDLVKVEGRTLVDGVLSAHEIKYLATPTALAPVSPDNQPVATPIVIPTSGADDDSHDENGFELEEDDVKHGGSSGSDSGSSISEDDHSGSGGGSDDGSDNSGSGSDNSGSNSGSDDSKSGGSSDGSGSSGSGSGEDAPDDD